jgi:branched-chain amino acid transport system substrate-binding protein
MKNIRNAGLALSALTLALAACSNAPQAPDKIKLGAVIPLTGRYAAGGEQVRNGYELAVEAINKAGGVELLGKKVPIELTILDDESDPTKTVQRMETLLSSNQVIAYLGGFGSDLHAASAAIAEKNKTPYVGVAFAYKGIHEKGFKYLFSPFPKSPDIAKATFDIFDTLPAKPVKVMGIIEKTDWGAELNGMWKAEAVKRGYQYSAEEYVTGAKDYAPIILKARDTSVDAVLSLPGPPDGLAIAKQMKELDYNPKINVMIRAPDNLTWASNLGKDGDFFVFVPGWSNDVKFAGASEVDKAHQAKYGKPAAAVVGPAYGVVQIVADSIKRAKAYDRDSIRDAIAGTNMNTVSGPVKFRGDGTGEIVTVVNQYQSGKQVAIWPPDQASTKIVYPAPAWKQR